MNETYSHILDSAASLHIPDDLNLIPLVRERLNQRRTIMQTLRARPALAILFAILALLLFSGAAYAIGRLTGYIPSVGLIDQSTPLRVLAEPVTVTRDGIALTVEQVVLSADKTVVIVKIEGVPMEAYPNTENDPGCIGTANLQLPDGTVLEGGNIRGGNLSSFRGRMEYGPFPVGLNEAVLRIDCIGGTLTGALPENWEVPIRFTPAPPGLTLVPVIDVPTPTPQPGATVEPAPIMLEKAIQIDDQYILMGKLEAQTPDGGIELTGYQMTDANGKEVFASFPTIEGLPSYDWGFQFKGDTVAYPITLTFTGRTITLIPNATTEFEFDAGENPQPGQEWVLNRDLEIAGHTVRLVSIMTENDGYSFNFETDSDVNSLSVAIPGYDVMGGGGGGAEGRFSTSIAFAQLPIGKLRIVFSDLTVFGETQTWQIQWQPETLPEVEVEPEAPSAAACVTSDNLGQLHVAPADMRGKALLYQHFEGEQNWGIVLTNLDGSQEQVIAHQGNWSSLSSDGSRVVYSSTDGVLHLVDVASGQDTALGSAAGYNAVWSLDRTQIAYIEDLSINIINVDGSNPRKLGGKDHYSLAGWAADGTKLYVTLPGADGFPLQSIDLTTGEIKSLFTLEDSSRKAPFATISPSGEWIAYRASDNSSLYLMQMDGSDEHLVLMRPADAISSIVWSNDSNWLGVSLVNSPTDERTLVLLQPWSCQAYLLPNLHGEFEGLFFP